MWDDKVDISIVIPAFNEAKRLPLFLDQLISYCMVSSVSFKRPAMK